MSQLVVLWLDNIYGSLVWILVWPFMFSPILFHYNWISFSFSPKSLPVVDRASDWQKLMVFKSLSDVSIFLSYCYNTIDYHMNLYLLTDGDRGGNPCTQGCPLHAQWLLQGHVYLWAPGSTGLQPVNQTHRTPRRHREGHLKVHVHRLFTRYTRV